MGRTKVVWQKNVFAHVRTLPKVMAEVDALAAEVASRAGDGYIHHSASETGGRVRGRAAVSTGLWPSIRDNAKNNTLLKALGGG